jgi:hypothetical protein
MLKPGGVAKSVEMPNEKRTKTHRWGATPKRGSDYPYEIVANRVVISVSGGNHREAKRRDPESWRNRLPDAEVRERIGKLAQRFTRLAMGRRQAATAKSGPSRIAEAAK